MAILDLAQAVEICSDIFHVLGHIYYEEVFAEHYENSL